MFCDNCGEKIDDGSIFCDKCGSSLIHESKSTGGQRKIIKSIKALVKNACSRVYKIKFDISGHRFATYFLLLFLLISGYFVYSLYTSTQDQLKKTQTELVSLRQSTTDAISSQKKLIEQQGENLSKQDEALKKSQTNETLLRKTLDNVEKAKVSNTGSSNINNLTLTEIAPSIVKVLCLADAYSESIKQGSGILYRAIAGNYYVQTNLHVADTSDGSVSRCAIVIYPDYSNSSNYLLFNSESYKFYNKGIDIAFLTPQLVSNSVFAGTFNDLSRYARDESKSPNCESVSIGDHLSILGYPGIGGDTLTVTDGIVSGFEFDYGTRYIKTSAKIEHGNSGGVAIKDSGCVAGIPTFVEQGRVESIGRILDLHYLFSVSLK